MCVFEGQSRWKTDYCSQCQVLRVDPRVTTVREIWSYPHSQLVQNQMVKKHYGGFTLHWLKPQVQNFCLRLLAVRHRLLHTPVYCSSGEPVFAGWRKTNLYLCASSGKSTQTPDVKTLTPLQNTIFTVSGGDRLNQHCVNLFRKMFI